VRNLFELRIYDETLVTFSFTSEEVGGFTVGIANTEGQRNLYPLDLEPTDEGLLRWLERRVIPKNRTFAAEILGTLGLTINDTKGIIDISKGLSLNDSYWVVPQGFDGRFAQFNLYENPFSEILSLVAFTGLPYGEAQFSTSPELTTDGMLPKGWRLIRNDGVYLYKGGTRGASNTGNEPYSEYYAGQIAEKMGLDAVHYDLEKWKGVLASKCKLFTDINTAYIPIGRIVKTGGLNAVVKCYDALGEAFADGVRDMLVFDALIYNTDRHFGNFGVLRDNKSGKIIAPAPIFDNGTSLFNFALPADFQNLDEYSRIRKPANSNVDFEDIVRIVMTPRRLEKLRSMMGFAFTRHERLNLPEYRLKAIERQLQRRVTQLIDIAKNRIKARTADSASL
jgi:hypothetical protein